MEKSGNSLLYINQTLSYCLYLKIIWMTEAAEKSSKGWNNTLFNFLPLFPRIGNELGCHLLQLAGKEWQKYSEVLTIVFLVVFFPSCSTWRHIKSENFQSKEEQRKPVNTHLRCSTFINVHGLTLCGSEKWIYLLCGIKFSKNQLMNI